MTWRLILTILEIAGLVVVLAIYLTTISRLLNSISANLARITFGVRAVETQCAVIGPAVDRINGNLAETANALNQSAIAAERLA
ncbi:MAG TPA: hypothetical protein VHG90_12195 [Acidimicrobiales bacterium]|nr:hypothetical protein [Acidimicrobiales bacterium]